MDESCDLIVIGGGHAGCEAAHIAAKMAHNVLLLTGSIDALGRDRKSTRLNSSH